MAEEPPGGEKTEAPTEQRRKQAREKGDRLQSRELATAMGGIAGAIWLAWFAGPMAAALQHGSAAALSIDRADLVDFRPVDRLVAILAPLAAPLGALAGLVLAGVVLGQLLSGGISLNAGLLAPKPGRLDPVAGLARMFGGKGLVELLKALLKATLLILLSVFVIRDALPVILSLSELPLSAAMPEAGRIALRLMLWLSLGLVLIAGFDLPVQILQWIKRLRMTKQELKDEMKQQEGSPEMKFAMRRMARDGLKRASRAAMADATVVLTNPTHFAVALRYRPEIDAAPLVVARGRGLIAEVIRELAAERGVTILSYPSVARALYFTGRVGQVIRPDLYLAVATILAFVLRVAQGEPPEVDAPDTARFDEEGRQTPG